MKIPPVKIVFSEEDKSEIKTKIDEVLSSGFLTLGKYVKEFEEKFLSYTNTKYGIATSSGTSALEIIFRSLNLKNEEIIVPTNTFFATPAAVLHSNNQVKFADCDESLCVNEQTIKQQITDKTKAVVVVHIGGIVTPEINEIKELCEKKGIILIEDAAHAQGSTLNGKKAGSFGDAAAFSFFATKVMTSAEGGIVVTNNKEIYENSLVLRNQGKEASRNIHHFLGHNWRMSEIHAVLGISQLKNLDSFIQERRSIAKMYDEELKNIQNITTLPITTNNISNYYKYTCYLNNINRDSLKKNMKEKHNIFLPGEVYEVPCHLQPVFSGLGYKKGDFPIAEKLCANHICLPVYANMGTEEANYVIDSLKEEMK